MASGMPRDGLWYIEPVHVSAERTRVRLSKALKRLWHEEEGQDLVEYSLLVILVALGCTAGIGFLANSINNTFSSAGGTLANLIATGKGTCCD